MILVADHTDRRANPALTFARPLFGEFHHFPLAVLCSPLLQTSQQSGCATTFAIIGGHLLRSTGRTLDVIYPEPPSFSGKTATHSDRELTTNLRVFRGSWLSTWEMRPFRRWRRPGCSCSPELAISRLIHLDKSSIDAQQLQTECCSISLPWSLQLDCNPPR